MPTACYCLNRRPQSYNAEDRQVVFEREKGAEHSSSLVHRAYRQEAIDVVV